MHRASSFELHGSIQFACARILPCKSELILKATPLFRNCGKQTSAQCARSTLLPGIQRVLRILIELPLQLEASVVCLDCLECFGYLTRPLFLIKVAEFLGSRSAIARVMIGEARIPPDA